MATYDSEIDQWLATNGLQHCIAQFQQHEIQNDVIFDLTAEDLRDAGIASMGDRIRILKLIDQKRPASQQSRIRGYTYKNELLDSHQLQLLRERLEASEKHVRKLNEQVARLRADLFRKFKESEPLPTPTTKNMSPATTPGSTLNLANAAVTNSSTSAATPMPVKRSPSDGYFSRPTAFPGSAVVSPNSARPSHSQQVHIFHGHYLPGSQSHLQSPSAQASFQSLMTAPSSGNANLVITAPSEPFKNFRCGERDNVAKVLSWLLQRKYLDGDISQWRLQIEYGDKARELLDHEKPLVVFKQLQDMGHKPIFTMKPAQPHKPPAGGSYI